LEPSNISKNHSFESLPYTKSTLTATINPNIDMELTPELEQACKSLPFALFVAVFVFRYSRLLVGIYAWNTYRAKPLYEKPMYHPSDVTVIVPTTFRTPAELMKSLRSIVRCSPAAIIIVTSFANVSLIQHLVALHSLPNTKVLGVERFNKREQVLRGLQDVDSYITVLADDDVLWPSRYFDYLLAIFEDPMVGAGGTKQRTVRRSGNVWNFLATSYLERRNFNNITTMATDGSISTLSGRTSAWRTSLLKDPEFVRFFSDDTFCGKVLNSDDDKCLSRWVQRGYSIAINPDPRATLETFLEEDSKLISQCLRWAKARFRGNITALLTESFPYKKPFGFYVIYLAMLNIALFTDGLQFWLLQLAFGSFPHARNVAFSVLAGWIFFTKVVKLVPHFLRHPGDVKWIPASILFSYLHGFITIYAVFTLSNTAWGSQPLQALEKARATDEEVVPLLKEAIAGAEGYREPT
jgi:cellulose synthase/poly-beta-1,6-N-acetylglucosamine synthase-like glycosyltransferase